MKSREKSVISDCVSKKSLGEHFFPVRWSVFTRKQCTLTGHGKVVTPNLRSDLPVDGAADAHQHKFVNKLLSKFQM